MSLTHVAIMCFFFALRSCEATATPTPGRTQTLTLQHVTFRDCNHQPIPLHQSHSPQVHSVTLRFANQKNGHKGESRTQSRTNDPELCPVRSVSHLVSHILQQQPNAPLTTPLSTVFPSPTPHDSRRLTNTDLLHHLRRACSLLGGRAAFGFANTEIGTRSLRCGAAMALFLAGHPPSNIMLLGRWRSTAFIEYLRPQILEWTSSLSPSMLYTNDFRDADAALHPPPPPPSRGITFHGPTFSTVSNGKKDSMACPEKDTSPEKDPKKGGEGSKSPLKIRMKTAHKFNPSNQNHTDRSRGAIESTATSDSLRCGTHRRHVRESKRENKPIEVETEDVQYRPEQ